MNSGNSSWLISTARCYRRSDAAQRSDEHSPTGCNFSELLRVIDSLQLTDNYTGAAIERALERDL
jgi:hypothetical protein